jgi:hypothetical protein
MSSTSPKVEIHAQTPKEYTNVDEEVKATDSYPDKHFYYEETLSIRKPTT